MAKGIKNNTGTPPGGRFTLTGLTRPKRTKAMEHPRPVPTPPRTRP